RTRSVAVVDIRVLPDDAVAAGVLAADEATFVLDAARRVHSSQRSLREAADVLGPKGSAAFLSFAVAQPRPQQVDALGALATAGTVAAPPAAPFTDTWNWGLLVRTEADWPSR